MNKIENRRIRLNENEAYLLKGGEYKPNRGFAYDVCWAIAYGFSALTDYIGNHASNYQLAFK